MIFFVRLENLMGCHLFYGDHSLQQSSNPEIKWCTTERTAEEKNAHTSFVNMNLQELCKIANEIILHGRAKDFGTFDYKIIDHLNTFG